MLPSSVWQGQRRSQVTLDVILTSFGGEKNQKEVVLSHQQLVLLSPVKQKQLTPAC